MRHTVALHDGQELDNDLGRRTDQDLALAGLLGVVDGIEAIVENGSLDHFGGCMRRFSSGSGRLRYLHVKSVVSLQMPERGECPQLLLTGRVLQLVSQRRSSITPVRSSLRTTTKTSASPGSLKGTRGRRKHTS